MNNTRCQKVRCAPDKIINFMNKLCLKMSMLLPSSYTDLNCIFHLKSKVLCESRLLNAHTYRNNGLASKVHRIVSMYRVMLAINDVEE